MELYHPPAKINDFALLPPQQADAYAKAWDEIINYWLDEAVRNYQIGGGTGLFYNPRYDDSAGDAAVAGIGWEAFPLVLTKWFENEATADDRRWATAEILRPLTRGGHQLRRVENGQLAESINICFRQQDEYCEWFVDRDEQSGTIRRVTFTAEGPEYWSFLATGTKGFFPPHDERNALIPGDKDLVTELYRRYVNPAVRQEDLFWNFDVAACAGSDNTGQCIGWRYFARRGEYNPYNKWNTTHGCMHLTHPSNTLQAEINLAAGATVLRIKEDFSPVTDITDLICCSQYGNVNRSSDPRIGAAVNEYARQDFSISLANPVGLYISHINLGAFEGPAGEDVREAWHVDRGNADEQMILRARFELSSSAPFTINQVKASNKAISSGGQIVDHIQMVLNGLAKNLNLEETVAKATCQGQGCVHPQKPEFRTIVDLKDRCEDIPLNEWALFAPVTVPSPYCGEAAGFAADEGTIPDARVEESGELIAHPQTRNAY